MAVTKFKKENTARPRIMIVTNSERPVTVAVGPWQGNPDASAFSVNVKSLDKALLKDSNGAGDSFVGGFLAKMCKIIKEERVESLVLNQVQLEQCVNAGTLIAQEVIQKYGCDFPAIETIKTKIEQSV